MGRTVIPFSQVIDREILKLKDFRKALRKADQRVFDELFDWARKHVQAGVTLSSPRPLEVLLLSILLEMKKALDTLHTRVNSNDGTKPP